MITENVYSAYFASRETNSMLMQVTIVSYSHHRCLCALRDGTHAHLPTELLFNTRDGAVEYARTRFAASIAAVEKDLKLLNEQLAYLNKLALKADA
jgi:hypothetical protein